MNVRLLPVLLLAAIPACGIFGSDPDEDEDTCQNRDPVLGCLDDPGRDIIVTAVNAGGQPVHLFLGTGIGTNETFPCCQVSAGGSRAVTLQLHVGGRVNITAGRNGNIIQTSHCTVTQGQFDSRTKTITWNDPGFSC